VGPECEGIYPLNRRTEKQINELDPCSQNGESAWTMALASGVTSRSLLVADSAEPLLPYAKWAPVARDDECELSPALKETPSINTQSRVQSLPPCASNFSYFGSDKYVRVRLITSPLRSPCNNYFFIFRRPRDIELPLLHHQSFREIVHTDIQRDH